METRVQLPDIRKALLEYIDTTILPRYDFFDSAHRREHAEMVMSRALDLAAFYPVDREMLYVAAAYHDLGLAEGRELHHLVSAQILREDAFLPGFFSASQIETMAQAVEDHRASAKNAPRDIYGKIIAEADRLIDPLMVVQRTVQYGLKHYPQLDSEGHYQRALQHLQEKYGPQGYLKLWIPESPNATKMKQLHALIADEKALRELIFSMLETQ